MTNVRYTCEWKQITGISIYNWWLTIAEHWQVDSFVVLKCSDLCSEFNLRRRIEDQKHKNAAICMTQLKLYTFDSWVALNSVVCEWVSVSGIGNTRPNLHFSNIYRHKSPLLSHAQYTWSSWIGFPFLILNSTKETVNSLPFKRTDSIKNVKRQPLKTSKLDCGKKLLKPI